MNWHATGITDRGLRRSTNEDVYRVREDVGLFLVADGMGGHAAGEVASAIAADVVEREGADALVEGAPIGPALRQAVRHAHHAILARAAEEPEKAGMGTTITALTLHPNEARFQIAHVGDSRAYRLRGGTLEQLTTDHTWVQREVETGRLSPTEARAHPYANILTRALGTPGEEPEIDLVEGDVVAGDLILLCTDGVTSLIEDDDLHAIVGQSLPLETLAAQIVEAARIRGGHDNITAILIRATA